MSFPAHPDVGSSVDPAGEPWRFRRNHWNNWVEAHAVMRPDQPAFRHLGTDTTWRQLHERSGAMASALHRRGIARGDRVLLLTLNRTEFFEAVLAINALGAIAVPVNFRLAPPEIAFIARNCGARGVFTEPTLAPLVIGRGGRDGETGDLKEFLAWTLDGTIPQD